MIPFNNMQRHTQTHSHTHRHAKCTRACTDVHVNTRIWTYVIMFRCTCGCTYNKKLCWTASLPKQKLFGMFAQENERFMVNMKLIYWPQIHCWLQRVNNVGFSPQFCFRIIFINFISCFEGHLRHSAPNFVCSNKSKKTLLLYYTTM